MASTAAKIVGVGFLIGLGAFVISSANRTDVRPNELSGRSPATDVDTAVISAYGFNCPRAVTKILQKPDAYGSVQRIYCALDSTNQTSFRVTTRPNGTLMVEPWK